VGSGSTEVGRDGWEVRTVFFIFWPFC
jgi:hypothetical protein